MAALIRHGSFASAFKSTSAILVAGSTVTVARRVIARQKSGRTTTSSGPVVKARIDSAGESLAARGFLRSQRSYEPLEDAAERIDRICESQTIPSNDDTELEDPVLRFKLLVACEEEFKHYIPNSLLYTIENIGDLKQFYLTPVDSTTPYDALCKADLPKNLHIQQQYHRFQSDNSTMFGKTAFPKSSTLVTGLKYKKKYPGHMQEDPWLEDLMKL